MMELGSDGSAACGGRSDRSEWQRSIKSRKSVSLKILSGTATGRRIGFRQPPQSTGKVTEYADVVELVDSLDLGSNARACRFESCHPHQEKRDPIGASLFLIRRLGLEPIKTQQSGGLLLADGWTAATP